MEVKTSSRLKQTLVATLILSSLHTTTAALAAGPIDLRPYFPAANNLYRTANGAASHVYNFFPSSSSQNPDFWNVYVNLFDLNSAGSLMIWEKAYYTPQATLCTKTYGFLWMGAGTDKSVREVGDWYNEAEPHPTTGACQSSWGALGYQKWPSGGYQPSPAPSFSLSNTTGLNWSGAGGLDDSWGSYQSGYVFRQYPNSSSPYAAGSPPPAEYSTPALIETFSSWSPAYGRNSSGQWVQNPGRSYSNVARIVLFHGVRNGSSTPACTDNTTSTNPYDGWYHHHGPVTVNGVSTNDFYGTYAMEFYVSAQYGILQETMLYDESSCASYGFPALVAGGTAYDNAIAVFRWYIDH